MPIDFDCVHCGHRVRVPDGMGGRRGSCPNCGESMIVPTPEAAAVQPATAAAPAAAVLPDSEVPPWATAAGDVATNPYATPATVSAPEAAAALPLGYGKLNATRALEAAWPLFKEHAWLLIGVFITFYGLSLGFSIGITLLVQLVVTSGIGSVSAQALAILLQIINQVFALWLTLGVVVVSLRVARRQAVSWSTMFSGSPYLLRTICAVLLFYVAFMLGICLLIIPGIYVATALWPFMYFIVDRDAGIVDSLRLSFQHTKGNKLQFILLGLVSAGLAILGFVALVVGVLVSYSLTMLMFANGYLMISGQFEDLQAAGENPFLSEDGSSSGENPFANSAILSGPVDGSTGQ